MASKSSMKRISMEVDYDVEKQEPSRYESEKFEAGEYSGTAQNYKDIRGVGSQHGDRGEKLEGRKHLDPEHPGDWVLEHHADNFISEIHRGTFLSELYRKYMIIQGKAKDWEGPRYRINFAELQRMKLRKFQCRLVKDTVEMSSSNKEVADWEKHLQEYVQAIQDYDYMTTRSQQPIDPFIVTGERHIDDYVLNTTIDHYIPQGLDKQKTTNDITSYITPPESELTRTPIGGIRQANAQRSELKSLRKKLTMAAVGGAFLVGPMWLMVLHRSRYTALVSTTVLVICFGITMACSLKSEMDVLSSTAAYAAVLVVFVGLNTS